MTLFIAALTVILAGAFSPLLPMSQRTVRGMFTGLTFLGCVLGFTVSLRVLLGTSFLPVSLPWAVPGGEFALAVDGLSALFLMVHFFVSALATLFALSYFGSGRLRQLRVFFGTFIVCIALVLTARNSVLFLAVWEMMAVSGFFLVTFDHHEKQVRRAGFLYLVATHVGTLCLYAAFVLLGQGAGSLNFSAMTQQSGLIPMGGAVFILALTGFGSKAGLMPVHIWLPEAHPAAPSPISALMSGVMLKTGIYGILRILSFFPEIPAWWGYTLGSVGIASAVLGVLWAMAQHDFKRLLAYSSIENIGIIVLGIGVGSLGLTFHDPVATALGFVGALWHVLNHGLFKSLLFLGAGSIVHATGTREMDRLGGLLKRMPFTGLAVLIGSASICGLPPLNGFISEFLIYWGAFHLGISNLSLHSFAAVPALALVGALAAECFSKAFGMQFLGTARTESAAHAHESDRWMTGPLIVLAAACIGVGVAPAYLLPLIDRAAGVLMQGTSSVDILQSPFSILSKTGYAALGVWGGIFALAGLRWVFLRQKDHRRVSTWGCGFSSPSARMQYTGSSYVQFPTNIFRNILLPIRKAREPQGYFPDSASFSSEAPDPVLDRFLATIWTWGHTWSVQVRRFQHGWIQIYLVYVFAFLLGLLLWKL